MRQSFQETFRSRYLYAEHVSRPCRDVHPFSHEISELGVPTSYTTRSQQTTGPMTQLAAALTTRPSVFGALRISAKPTQLSHTSSYTGAIAAHSQCWKAGGHAGYARTGRRSLGPSAAMKFVCHHTTQYAEDCVPCLLLGEQNHRILK